MEKQEPMDYFDGELLDKLFAFSYARTNDSYEAQELCSDIIFELVKAARAGRKIRNFYPFAWRVARNVYYDFVKRKKRQQDVFGEGGLKEGAAFMAGREEEESRDLLEAVYQQIAFLSQAYREVMIQFYIDGLSTAEIAKIQNISETTVRQRLSWARYKIKNEVKDMERAYEKPLLFDEKSYAIYGNGDPSWGDPTGTAARILSRHILWLCRKKPVRAAEIAEQLKVPAVYIEDELEALSNGKNGEYGLLRRMGSQRYVINFILLDKAAMIKAVQIYSRQMPKVCSIIVDYIREHREEYLGFPYLNANVAEKGPDLNLVLWQQLVIIARSFCDNVERILAEKYFAEQKEPGRPYTVFGHADIGASYGIIWDSTYAERLGGYKFVSVSNICSAYINGHFRAGHNISCDPRLLMALRAIGGLRASSLSEGEKEHAAKAVESGYLCREGDMLYTKILVNSMNDDPRLFEVSGRLSKGYFEEEAQETAREMAALIYKAVPKHLLGEWRFANKLAGMPVSEFVAKELIAQGILMPPGDGAGAEGCWMSVI